METNGYVGKSSEMFKPESTEGVGNKEVLKG